MNQNKVENRQAMDAAALVDEAVFIHDGERGRLEALGAVNQGSVVLFCCCSLGRNPDRLAESAAELTGQRTQVDHVDQVRKIDILGIEWSGGEAALQT
ncbi:MAG TPA: hypothetical protein VGB94_02485 [Acidobacteriaceae bacterium]